MKLKKIITAVLLTSILGLFAGLLLTGCSGTNQALEKDHIMNDGCFITCYNNAHNDKVAKKMPTAENMQIIQSANTIPLITINLPKKFTDD